MPKSKTNYSISLLRLTAILSIVCCHITQQYGLYAATWLNVGVQVFLSISGYLYGQKAISDPRSWLVKRFEKIYTPYVLFLVAAILVFACFDPSLLSWNIVFSFFCLQAFFGTIPNLGHLWYVSIILLCYLITPLWERIIRSQSVNCSLATALACCLLFAVAAVSGCGYIAWVSSYLLGYYYSSRGFVSLARRNAVSFMWLTVGLTSALGTAFVGGGATASLLSKIAHISLGLVITLLGISSLKSKSLQSCNALRRILDWNDRYSYAVYLVHLPFVLGAFSPLSEALPTWAAMLYLAIAIPVILILAFALQEASDLVIRKLSSLNAKPME